MFDQLFEVLGTYESNLAEKTKESKNRKFIKTLLTSGEQQITTLLQNPAKLPKGARTSLQTIKRVLGDCLSGMNTGNISYSELRAAARDIIGREHAKLKRLDAAESKQTTELEFEDDDHAPMAASAAVKVKIKLFESALSARYVVNEHLSGPSAVRMIRQVAELVEVLGDKMSRMTDSEVKKIDVSKLVLNHTLEELNEISPTEMISGKSEDSDELKELVASYKHIMHKLPSTMHSAFQAFEFSVVPLFTGLSPNGSARKAFLDAMAHAGVKVRMIGDHYPVFEKQYLLALDCARLGIPKDLKQTKTGKTKTVNNSKADNGPDTIVGGVLATINSVSPIQYVPASAQLINNPRNPAVKLMWIVPEKVRLAISRALHTSEVKWGLPAEIDG